MYIACLNISQDIHVKLRNDSQLYVHCKQSNMHGNISNHKNNKNKEKNKYTQEEIKLIPDKLYLTTKIKK